MTHSDPNKVNRGGLTVSEARRHRIIPIWHTDALVLLRNQTHNFEIRASAGDSELLIRSVHDCGIIRVNMRQTTQHTAVCQSYSNRIGVFEMRLGVLTRMSRYGSCLANWRLAGKMASSIAKLFTLRSHVWARSRDDLVRGRYGTSQM